MSYQKTSNDLKQFEKDISNTLIKFLTITILITTMLFTVIYYQTISKENTLRLKNIEIAASLFESSLSEKISIIASSNIFLDFLTSGNITRKELEPKFLTELLPLKSSGIIGYALQDTDTGLTYNFGNESNQSITLKLCYLADKIDNKNGNCNASIKLFFSEGKIEKNISAINKSIKSCKVCQPYNLINNGHFGNFIVSDQNNFSAQLTTEIKSDYIFLYYFSIISILIGFAVSAKINFRKRIRTNISEPLNILVNSLKKHSPLISDFNAVDEINYLSAQIEENRKQISKISEYEKKAEIGHLAASVVHDIMSPLAVLDITMSQVAKDIPNIQYSLLNHAIQRVRDISNNLLERYRQPDLIDNLSYQSKLPKENNDSSVDASSLIHIIESIISQKNQEWSINPCELRLLINENIEPANILADPVEIRRIISNLLNNAYEALENSREINVNIDLYNNFLRIDIQDFGRGVQDHQIRLILNGLSLKHSGEGLGLSCAKKYIEKIGGSIKLFSKISEGTNVTLLFPLTL